MPVRNTCWESWRARLRIYPARYSISPRPPQLEPNFADAYLGLGMSLLAEKKYPEAVAPLEKAVKLQPANPAGHYSLATAYARTGRKEDADREFALQQQTSDPRADREPRIRSDRNSHGYPAGIFFGPWPAPPDSLPASWPHSLDAAPALSL